MKLKTCKLCGTSGTGFDKHHPFFRHFCRDKIIWLCRKCHTFIHENVKWATENGYIIRDHSYEKKYHEQ